MAEQPMRSDAGQRMMTYLPDYYAESRLMRSLVDSQGVELSGMQQALDDILDQLFVQRATWGLARWEQEYGIATDETKPMEQRRSVILSKVRGIGRVTAGLIKNVAESYANGEVAVEVDYAGYSVKITFVSAYGVPPNMADVEAAIRSVLPAHLAVRFVYRFYTYSQLLGSGKTYAQAAGVTYNQLYNGGLT